MIMTKNMWIDISVPGSDEAIARERRESRIGGFPVGMTLKVSRILSHSEICTKS